jgi:hypothetical protein
MTLLKPIAGVILIAAVGVGVFQRNSIAKLRGENAQLREQTAPPADDTRAASPADTAEIQALADATKDLPRLRNEVRQWRQQKPEAERLRRENAELAARLASATNRASLAQMEGYVGKDQWTQAGFATPDAAVQSFFWAVANEDLAFLVQCMSPRMRADFEREFQGKTPDEQAAAFRKGIGQFNKLSGYRIAERRQLADDRVELGIQAAAGGQVMPMQLLRSPDGQWQLNVK